MKVSLGIRIAALVLMDLPITGLALASSMIPLNTVRLMAL